VWITDSRQASAEHFQQFAEFLPLSHRRPTPIAVTPLTVALAKWSTTTGSAAMEAASLFYRRRRPDCGGCGFAGWAATGGKPKATDTAAARMAGTI
jgi:hypothetical protein